MNSTSTIAALGSFVGRHSRFARKHYANVMSTLAVSAEAPLRSGSKRRNVLKESRSMRGSVLLTARKGVGDV
jgi:hypothetical protein